MRRWTEVERRRLKRRHSDECSVKKIAAEQRRTVSAVRTALSRQGLTSQPSPSPALTIPPPPSLLDAFLRKPTGTALPRIPVKREPPPARPGRRAPSQTWTAERIATITKMVADGHTNAEIAFAVDCTHVALTSCLHERRILRGSDLLKKQRSGISPTLDAGP